MNNELNGQNGNGYQPNKPGSSSPPGNKSLNLRLIETMIRNYGATRALAELREITGGNHLITRSRAEAELLEIMVKIEDMTGAL
ncbi:hypothetical protein SmaMPs15_000082 [Stenotrophomonas maltophilia phage vB_SmaM_Ps15]|uniref:Uncharacterized protein n=1 Tax=Stenotrophomonas maltophilia phage vB_SmaM_Ps15 TaxID=3071007 RepID=A0AAE9FP71_9CAUD|nr:hypothetical protein PQC01_gp082 [Stenotrophomonas maltophilia phage vB_SmaM_Ps15]UMO77233.1 hypothetical protein SmaMPs15_000082 [Stenotrophomonas maltophilia phage vB_SmaM_Ps15]